MAHVKHDERYESLPVERVAGLDDLADAVVSLRTRDEARRFLRDLCTLPELEALGHRWQTALLLEQGRPYAEIGPVRRACPIFYADRGVRRSRDPFEGSKMQRAKWST